MPILTRKFLVENKEEKEQVVTPSILDSYDTEVAPNVTVEDQSQVPETEPVLTKTISTMSKTELEDLEDKINMNSSFVDDTITESFYELNKDIMMSQSLLESISISAIHSQYKILTECSYGSEEYNSEIESLTEATGIAIIDKLIEIIKNFISKAKEILSNLGVTLSMAFVDYEKWATNKESDLIDKASKYGSEVSVKIHEWNEDLLFETLPLGEIESIVEDICPIAYDKDEMEKIVDKVMDKYDTAEQAGSDAYVKALAVAVGGNPGSDVHADRSMAIDAIRVKLMGTEKDKYMEAKRTSDFLIKLKKIKTRTSRCISHMRKNGVNMHFERLIKDAKNEANKRADKESSKKYSYYRLRFTILSSVQTAINDLYKIKTQFMQAYAREMYNCLKKLDSYKSDSDGDKTKNESIDFDSATNFIGGTLHE